MGEHDHGGLDDLHAALDTTPTFEAAREGHVDALAALLDADRAQLYARDKYGLTPLHWACDRDHVRAAELLLERGADVNALEKRLFKRTPLLFAALVVARGSGEESEGAALVQLLLRHGASVSAADYKGWRAVHCAAHAGNVDVLRALAAAGAEISALTKRGESVLHVAARAGHAALLAALLGDAKSDDGALPLVKDVRLLVDVRDADGCSAADVAHAAGHAAIVAFLAERSSSS